MFARKPKNIKPREGGQASTLQNIARRLRQSIMEQEDGAYLGSEDTLLTQLGVSRPTLRQVARMLEHEMLLTVRRGGNGGYFSRRPSPEGIVRSAALYLRLHNTRLTDVLATAQLLNVEVCRLASRSENQQAQMALVTLFERLENHNPAAGLPARFLAEEDAIRTAILSLVDNPPLVLLSTILHEFGLRQSDQRLYEGHPDRQHLWRQGRLQLIRAILESDADMAALLSRRQSRIIISWVEENKDAQADWMLKSDLVVLLEKSLV
jgi:DNA-binding FadR family transcriptional regulator